MKNIKAIILMMAVFFATTSASEIAVTLKGIAGIEDNINNGPLMGGGMDILYKATDHVGIAVEADAGGANMSLNSDGLTVSKNYYLSIPIMAWFSYNVKNLELGAGAGIATVFRDETISVDLGASVKAVYWISDFGITLGASGTLDCFPKLESTKNKNGSKTYSFESSDGADSAILFSLGVTYRFKLGK